MQLGNQVEWGLHCVVILAGLPADARLSAATMAELYEVPPKYLAKALQALAVAGLVTTMPGPKGGYCLSRAPREITVKDVFEAIEGKASMFQCQEIRRRGPCRQVGKAAFSSTCQIAAVMHEAERAYRRVLESKTVADLLGEVVRDVPPALLSVVQTWVEPRIVRGGARTGG